MSGQPREPTREPEAAVDAADLPERRRAQRDRERVMRLLQGETLDAVSREGRTAKSGRVFFVSIPKCGKNVVLTFLDRLGLVPFEVERNRAAEYTHAKYGEMTDREALLRGGSALPSVGSWEEILHTVREPSMHEFLKALRQMPEGTWVHHHFAFNQELHQVLRAAAIPIVFLYRDPRDCLLSMANFLLMKGEPADFVRQLPRPELEAALTLFLEGDDHLPFDQYFESYRGWLEADGVLSLRFEDIIGPKGGGQESAQIASLMTLAHHIGWKGSMHRLGRAILKSFSPRAATFYKGQIGGWRESFSAPVRHLFEERAGHLLQTWGYDGASMGQPPTAAFMPDAVNCLLAKMCREYGKAARHLKRLRRTNAELESLLRAVEQDSQERLAEIRRRDATIVALQKLTIRVRLLQRMRRLIQG